MVDCYNCKKHCWVFTEDGCDSFCMEKGAEITEEFAQKVHLCSQPEDNNDYHGA